MNRTLQLLVLLAAALILAASVVVQALTYSPSARLGAGDVWPLHVATIGVWAGVLLFVLPRRRAPPRPAWVGMPLTPAGGPPRDPHFKRRMFATVPRPLRLLFVAVAVYAFATFFVSLTRLRGGMPTADGGHYALKSRGRVVRELNEAEYRQLRALQLRAFSSLWIVFNSAAVLAAAFVGPRRAELMRPPQDSSAEAATKS